MSIFNIKSSSITLIYLSLKILRYNLNLNVNFIECTELKIKRDNNYYSVKIVFDKNVSSFSGDIFYLLEDSLINYHLINKFYICICYEKYIFKYFYYFINNFCCFFINWG